MISLAGSITTNKAIIQSLCIQWAVVVAAWILTGAAALVYVHVLRGAPELVFDTATVGLRNVSVPLIEEVKSSGLPHFLGFVLVNGSATLLFFSIALLVRLADPSRKEEFPRYIRRSVFNDPTQYLFWPIPAFRRIPKGDLRPLFQMLVVTPLVIPALVGTIIGVVTSFFVDPSHIVASIVWSALLILPHASFELTALFLAPAALHALYRRLKPDIEAGKTRDVWAVLRPELEVRPWIPRLGLALFLILVAACMEAYATEKVANLFAGWVGLPLI